MIQLLSSGLPPLRVLKQSPTDTAPVRPEAVWTKVFGLGQRDYLIACPGYF
jgi:hypothetical protein